MQRKKTLLWLALLFFLIFPLGWGTLVNPGLAGDYLSKLSRLTALLGLVLFIVQIVLGAKVRFIEAEFGHDRMVSLHRMLGLLAFIFVLFHALISMMNTLGREPIALLMGVVAFFLFIFMLLFIVAKKLFKSRYDYWEIVHQLNYLVFPLAFVHSVLLGGSIRSNIVWQVLWASTGLAFVGVVVYKAFNYYQIKKHPFGIDQVTQENGDVWTLRFEPRKVIYQPGQFMILRLIRDGLPGEPHPFTIASSPSDVAFSVSIKESGDFTRTIKQVKPGDTALIDAPYGKFSFLEYPSESYVFIAGGIGITPFLSMLRYVRDKNLEQKIILLWGNRTEQDIVFRQEVDQIGKYLTNIKIVHVLSEPAEGWEGEAGFINADLILKYAEDLTGKEIMICGPPVMISFVVKTLKTLGVSKRKIHFEKFNW